MNKEAATGAFSSMSKLYATYERLEGRLTATNDHSTSEERKQEIMNLLHEFNDVKDAAQVVIGVLANMEGKTIKEMHIHYNLPTSEE